MFSNRSLKNKILFKFGPYGVVFLFLLLVVLVAFFLIKRHNKKILLDTNNKFRKLIYTYTHDYNKSTSDNMIDFYIKSFTFDTEMWNANVLDNSYSVDNMSWYSDSEVFGSLIKTLHNMLSSTLRKQSRHYRSETVWKIIDHAIRECSRKLPSEPRNFSFPWGENWYQFSITYPLFLVSASYIREAEYNKIDLFSSRHLTSYISNYFKPSPKGIFSMGYLRDGANAIMMAVPYIGGNLLMNTYSEKDRSLEYVRKYCRLDPVKEGEGLFSDGSYITHTSLRGFGYLTSALEDFRLVSKFFGNENTITLINRSLEKTEHPNIPLHFGPWFTRTGKLESFANHKKGRLGFCVLDHMRGVSVKTDNWIIAFNGQNPALCYYEADQANYAWAQYWFGARRFLYADTEGSIHQKLLPYYSGVMSYNNRLLEIRSPTTTTTTFLPGRAMCVICQLPGCVAMFNKYFIKYSDFVFDVEEINIITSNGGHFYYQIVPDLKTHAANPMHIGVNFGQIEAAGAVPGIGKSFTFKDNVCFVYAKENEIKQSEIKHPQKQNTKLQCLQIAPTLVNSSRNLTCGFSIMHNSKDSNEVVSTPSINKIQTPDYAVYRDQRYPHLLFLHDIKKQICAVSEDMGTTVRSSISIPIEALQTVLNEDSYTIPQAITMNNKYTKNITPGHKYQIVVENIKYSS